MYYSCNFTYQGDTAMLNELVTGMNEFSIQNKMPDSYCMVVVETSAFAYFFTQSKMAEGHFSALLSRQGIDAVKLKQEDLIRIKSVETRKRIICSHPLFEEIIEKMTVVDP